MKYKEILLDLLINGSEEDLIAFIESQPLLDQPEVMRELKAIVEELEDETGIVEPGLTKEIEAFADRYEEAVLDEKLAEQMYLIEKEKADKYMDEMFETVEGMREYVIECIVTNAPNAKEMRELAKLIIKFEKDADVFDPENWKEIEIE